MRRGAFTVGVVWSPRVGQGWGAALLPYRAEDVSDWPIGIPELTEHYRAVLSFVKMSAPW